MTIASNIYQKQRNQNNFNRTDNTKNKIVRYKLQIVDYLYSILIRGQTKKNMVAI